VKEIADLVGYSYDYFRHQFLKYFGVSPKDYIINERISRAKKRLIETDDSIAKIAERYSFDSPSHFTRIFKKVVGISPLEYRNTQRKHQGEIQVEYENSTKMEEG
jgi:AraC family transcriptional activator of pobA